MFYNVLIDYSNPNEWRLLVLDGHESHISYPFISYAHAHKILLQVLPAHSSHLTQPLDVCLYAPVQYKYGCLVADWYKEGGIALTKADFLPLLKQVRDTTYTVDAIRKAWETSGLIPWCPRKVLMKLQQFPYDQKEDHFTSLQTATPKNPRQVNMLTKHIEQKLGSENVNAEVLELVQKLQHATLDSMSDKTITAHEVEGLKNRIDQHKGHKKSRARLPISPGKGPRLIDSAAVQRGLEKWHKKHGEKSPEIVPEDIEDSDVIYVMSGPATSKTPCSDRNRLVESPAKRRVKFPRTSGRKDGQK
jgi:DDE superfamily endonuclease